MTVFEVNSLFFVFFAFSTFSRLHTLDLSQMHIRDGTFLDAIGTCCGTHLRALILRNCFTNIGEPAVRMRVRPEAGSGPMILGLRINHNRAGPMILDLRISNDPAGPKILGPCAGLGRTDLCLSRKC